MSWETELAKMFKERNNAPVQGATTGIIIGLNPIKINLYNGSVILNENDIIMCNSLKQSTYAVTINGTDTEIIFKDILKINDKVLCLPTSKGQKYYVIDKVV